MASGAAGVRARRAEKEHAKRLAKHQARGTTMRKSPVPLPSGLTAEQQEVERKKRRSDRLKQVYWADPEKQRKAKRESRAHRPRILKQYGLAQEGYDALLQAQGGVCATCGTSSPGARSVDFDIDHDHATGQVRGLLCRRCNNALGLVDDRIETLEAMVAYLKRCPWRDYCPTAMRVMS